MSKRLQICPSRRTPSEVWLSRLPPLTPSHDIRVVNTGLKKASFVTMTEIQEKSLPVALKGRDILGAARTGSGKTLAFLIPVLDVLYRRKWGPQDGLGALIISPTRELVRVVLSSCSRHG